MEYVHVRGSSSSLLLLLRTHGKHIILNCKEVGRKPPSFGDASVVATELLSSGFEFDQGSVIFNRFRWGVLSGSGGGGGVPIPP